VDLSAILGRYISLPRVATGRMISGFMTDQQNQQRINEAADRFTDALVRSYQAVPQRGESAQEQNAQATQEFFNKVINNLRSETEANRELGQRLADQQQRQAEAGRTLTQESVSAYMDFVDPTFGFWQGGVRTAERGAKETEKATKGQKKS
jgi:hypothetical protein